MTDTPRTKDEIISLFSTNQTGNISAQDLRDFVVTIMANTRLLSEWNGDLITMRDAIGSTAVTLIINQVPEALTEDCILPANISLAWDQGCILPTSAFTLTHNGSLIAGNYQLFDSGATIRGLYYINVKWFGALGDGTTDDITAIQGTFNSFNGTFGTVLLPASASSYIISKPIVMAGGQQLIGENKKSSLIEKNTNTTRSSGELDFPDADYISIDAAIILATHDNSTLSQAAEVKIENLSINGNIIDYAAVPGTLQWAIYGNPQGYPANCKIDNININYIHGGVYGEYMNTSKLDMLRIRASRYGVYMDDHHYTSLNNIFITSTAVSAVHMESALSVHCKNVIGEFLNGTTFMTLNGVKGEFVGCGVEPTVEDMVDIWDINNNSYIDIIGFTSSGVPVGDNPAFNSVFKISDDALVTLDSANINNYIGGTHPGQLLDLDSASTGNLEIKNSYLTTFATPSIAEEGADGANQSISVKSAYPLTVKENRNGNSAGITNRYYKTPGALTIADNDVILLNEYKADDDGGGIDIYLRQFYMVSDASAGAESGRYNFNMLMNGAERSFLNMLGYNGTPGEGLINFNGDGRDIDFVIEASGVSDALEVRGSDGQITLGALGAGDVQSDASGVLSVISDRRFKTHVGDIEDGSLSKILKIKPVYFRLKSDEEAEIYEKKPVYDKEGKQVGIKRVSTGKKRFDNEKIKRLGFYAQDVNPIIPEAAPYDSKKDIYGLDTRAIVAHLVKAVQELSAEVCELKVQIISK